MASYRASFVVELVSNLGSTALDVVTVVVLFRVTTQLGGFTLAEAVLIVSLSASGFVLADFTVGNIDRLKTYVRTGLMDAVLVRPLGAMMQLILMDLPIRKALRLVVAVAVLAVGIRINHIVWTPGRAVLVAIAPIAGGVIFGSIFVLSASLAFWWTESGEIGAAFTYGGRDFTSYPVTVFGGWFRAGFAYGLASAFVAYQPALTLLGKPDPDGLPDWAGYLSPLVAVLAAAAAGLVWRI